MQLSSRLDPQHTSIGPTQILTCADAVKARPSLNGGEPVRKGRCPLNPAPPGALAGAWPPGGPGRGLGTAQAATPNANSNLRRRGTKTRH